MTAEELHLVVAEAQTAGVLEESERAIISGIVRLADRPVREVMTPRTDVDWIDIDCSREEIRAALADIAAQPDAGGRRVGRQYRRRDSDPRHADRAARRAADRPAARFAASAPVIPDLMDAMDALAVLRGADVPLALVHDEYGHLDGIVTPGSILAALAGAFAHDIDEDDDPPLVEREDGSWLVSGAASADLLSDRLGVQHAARPRLFDRRRLRAVGAQAFPGDRRDLPPRRLEVRDRRLDGRKIDKLIAVAVAPQARHERRGVER